MRHLIIFSSYTFGIFPVSYTHLDVYKRQVSTDAKTGTKSNVIIALDLPSNIDVSDKTKAKTALDSINAVLTRIRSGYRDISTNETQVALRKQSAASTSAKGKTSSGSSAAVAAYQAQTANMQAALARSGSSSAKRWVSM